jgi:uncharacterized membrane protein YjgN (DUF898 family)
MACVGTLRTCGAPAPLTLVVRIFVNTRICFEVRLLIRIMEAKDLIAIFIATLSLFVSVYALYLQHNQHNERLKVKGSFGFLATQGDLSEGMVLLEASNIGHRSITISSFGLAMPNKKVMLLPYRQQHVSLPHELLAGKSCTMCQVPAGYKRAS